MLPCALATLKTFGDIVVTAGDQGGDHLRLVRLGARKNGPRGARRALQNH
jgi:hypothetical protein